MSAASARSQPALGRDLANGRAEDSERWDQLFLPPPLRIEDRVRAQKIESRLSGMILGGFTLRRVADAFNREMDLGLARNPKEPSSLQMENTFIPELPNGTEEGKFLALDLGGTNFRVLLLELVDGKLVREDVKQYHINNALRLGPGEDLFNFLADCVLDFVRSEGIEHEDLPLGFTFSFPLEQTSITSGQLITWTKTFKCGGMKGVDVVDLLQRCLDARNLNITVQVLLNDTTGTLVAGAYEDPTVGVGVILGTGSNGCYMERASRITQWGETHHDRVKDVCVDIEWGAFGDNGCLDFLRTDIDRDVDALSLLVSSFTFEKYIGGKYLGDVLSVALGALARDGLFPASPKPGVLLTAQLSLIEEEACAGQLTQTMQVLQEACGTPVAEEDAHIAQYVAQVISNRAAQLVSVCISTILRRMDRPYVSVAVDGSVFKKHPRIRQLMYRYVGLLAPEHKFSLLAAEDGSGKGSALTAAIAARIAARSP
ncbi:hexokinase-2 [Amyelois transitella]|uniref:hexokinase-2 n=1 Tax=Amyelois transitella TaxID=680683 RepID=UPI00067BFCB4|nr:hexokinase-2 [Amyelois transitella]XP_060807601.1 hexokinase-2 [Amyelois transitella]XP_060807603.1 hexokinase-2 [Amyelois transitella]XP_060807604.1 hexokinase-2 [Amyelois transitella]